MKVLANISVTFTTLILLLFGASGIGMERCICTGKTTVMLPGAHDFCTDEEDCCGDDEDCNDDCDTVVIVNLSDYLAGSEQQTVFSGQCLVFSGQSLPTINHPLPTYISHSSFLTPHSSFFLRGAETTTVLRV